MDPIVVEFPLRGEWIAPNTPGDKVPSHGTDMLGQTYAYDLMQIDWRYPKKYRFFNKPLIPALIFGVRLQDCFDWRQPIHAPFDAEVIEVGDGIRERDPVHVVRDLLVVLKNGLFFRAHNNHDLRPLLGNYIILKGQQCYAMFAHAHTGSIRVKAGDNVSTGDQFAAVGHSGNSTAPHLHFQLMDNPDLLNATGLPCCFREYELYHEDRWIRVYNGIPDRYDRIRVL